MAIHDRLFTADAAVIALYTDAASPSSPTLITNLLSVFKKCSIKGATQHDPGRATSEGVDRVLPYSKKYTIEVGTVADYTLPSLFRIYIAYGPGPYWVWIQLASGDPTVIGWSFVTRAIIESVNISASGEADDEGMSLEVIQEFQPTGSTNKIG